MCLVNNAVYIAKYADAEKCEELYGYVPVDNKNHPGEWTATGTQFQIPYVFKTLFSKENITFDDVCETKSVTSSALYLDMNEGLEDVTLWEEVKKLRHSTSERHTRKEENLLEDYQDISDDELEERIAKGHKYKFIGRVGQFCPVKEGTGGGVLVREKDGKYFAATGTTGYKWKESETIRTLHMEDDIDTSYYDNLVTDAAHTIAAYGDLEWFISDDSGELNKIKNEEMLYTT